MKKAHMCCGIVQRDIVVQCSVDSSRPSPRGIAHRHNKKKLAERENPSSARAVIAVLKAETLFVPNRLITLALIRLEIMVPEEMMMETKLAKEMGRWKSV